VEDYFERMKHTHTVLSLPFFSFQENFLEARGRKEKEADEFLFAGLRKGRNCQEESISPGVICFYLHWFLA